MVEEIPPPSSWLRSFFALVLKRQSREPSARRKAHTTPAASIVKTLPPATIGWAVSWRR